jgi:hypothetical protein
MHFMREEGSRIWDRTQYEASRVWAKFQSDSELERVESTSHSICEVESGTATHAYAGGGMLGGVYAQTTHWPLLCDLWQCIDMY